MNPLCDELRGTVGEYGSPSDETIHMRWMGRLINLLHRIMQKQYEAYFPVRMHAPRCRPLRASPATACAAKFASSARFACRAGVELFTTKKTNILF